MAMISIHGSFENIISPWVVDMFRTLGKPFFLGRSSLLQLHNILDANPRIIEYKSIHRGCIVNTKTACNRYILQENGHDWLFSI